MTVIPAEMPPEVQRSVERFVPLLLMIVVLVAAISSITPWPVGAYEDDAIYTLLAKALATGDGYRMVNLPGAPHATHFPPGYPYLLSLLWRVAPDFPDNVVVFKFMNAALLAAAAGGVYWFVRARVGFGAVAAAVIAAFGTVSLAMLQLAALVMSEPLFITLLFLALLAVERSAGSGSLRHAALAGVLLGSLCLVRTVGVAAIGSAVLVLLLRRRLTAAVVVVAVTAVFLVPWQLWVSAHQAELPPILQGKYGSYGSWLADGYRAGGVDFARRVVIENLASMGNSLSNLVMPAPYFWPRLASLVILVVAAGAGSLLLLKRAASLVAFLALYVTLIIVWPFDPYRFLLALWPVLAIVLGVAIRELWQWRPATVLPTTIRWAALGAAAYLVLGHAAWNWQGLRGASWTDLQRQAGVSARPLLEWVSRNTRPDDVLSTEHDVLVYLYTGRRGVPVSTFLASQRVAPFTPSDNIHWVAAMVRTYEPRYLITGWTPHVAAADTLSAQPAPALRRAGSIPHHTIYERIVR